MKVAFVIYSLGQGGAERVVSLLSKSLSQEHEVTIVLFEKRVAYAYGGKLVSLDMGAAKGRFGKAVNVLRRTRRLGKLFRQEAYDRIYCFMETAYIPAILTGAPVIASVRNNPHYYSRFITTHFLPRARKVVAVSSEISRILEKEFGVKGVVTIKNPVDFDAIERLRNMPIDEEGPFIMAVGRLHRQKGFDLLIRAYARSSVKTKMRLLIFGEGGQREELCQLIREEGVENSVILKGVTDNVYRYMTRTELFVLSSRYEGFPNVLVEALACGAPVVASDCPTGPAEIVRNEENGLLVPVNNIDAMTKAIERLCRDRELREKFKSSARDSVKHLAVDRIAEQWIRL